jgi:uncharacterized membrane protein YbhN (UPF0104 family)
MSRTVWAWARVVVPVLVLAAVVWRLGTGPFLTAIGSVDVWTLLPAAGIAALTTVCCAWRWTIVARGLGIELSLPAAVAAYYRSQFLNLTLPGGVVGDVHRGVHHGREVRDVGRALRAVVLERLAGQLVQALVTVGVLLALPSPVQSSMPVLVIAALAAMVGVWLVARRRPGGTRSPWARVRHAVAGDARGRIAPRAWVGIGLASAVVVAGHATTFLIAARAAGTAASPWQLLPIALLAMMAMVLPSVAGWGPREGVTAWAFSAAGLGAGRGVATGVIYGVMVLFASLPGIAVLGVTWLHSVQLPKRKPTPRRQNAVHA